LINRNVGENESKSSIFSIDPYTIENLGLSTIAGRNFEANLQDDEVNAILINEKALDVMGFENAEAALNQTIEIKTKTEFGESSTKNRIIGIIRHFDFQFSFKESGPLVMNYDPSNLNMIKIKIEGAATLQAYEAIENVWETFDTDTPLEFELYESNIYSIDKEFEELVGRVGVVAFIAILIICLGQVSMIIHHIQLKVKEIGIRKVLGANLWQLMFKLSRGFLVIIVVAIMLATPIAWKINVFWTSKIYITPEVSIGNLSIGIGLVLLMAFMTMFVIIRKAVHQNPVESLKYE
jgi:putative ABC transport system permease protein